VSKRDLAPTKEETKRAGDRLIRFARISLRCFALLALALPAVSGAWGSPALRVVKVSQQRIDSPLYTRGEPGPRVNLPFFTGAGELRWDGSPVHAKATGDCDTRPLPRKNGIPLYPRTARLASPRVDSRACRNDVTIRTSLVGLDETGRLRWDRPLPLSQGLPSTLIGASRDGLILSTLEVWSPVGGANLLPPHPATLFPDAGLYRPRHRDLVLFDGEATPFSDRGGLWRFDTASRRSEPLQPAKRHWGIGRILVEEMAQDPAEKYLYLAKRLEIRGPGWVAFEVFDPARRTTLFEEKFGRGKACSNVHVVAGPDGNVAFSFHDGESFVLIHYRIAP